MRKILVAILLSAVASSATSQSPAKSPSRDRVNVERLLRTLAHDSMEGRGTATRGEERASRFLAAEMKKIGLKPMGDDGYFQRVPMAMLVANRPGGVRPPAGCQAGTFTVAGDSVGSPLWKCTATAPAGATPATTPTVTFRVPPSPAAAVPRLTMLPSLAAYDTMPAASAALPAT
jgi:hypothetical protein